MPYSYCSNSNWIGKLPSCVSTFIDTWQMVGGVSSVGSEGPEHFGCNYEEHGMLACASSFGLRIQTLELGSERSSLDFCWVTV